MDNFIVGIPTYNRADLLVPSHQNYIKNFETVVVIDNGQQKLSEKIKSDNLISNITNRGVAGSWNDFCYLAFNVYEKDWVLLVNDDILLGYGSDVVNQAISRCKSGLAQSERSFSVVLLSKALYEKVGAFDETFYPAYYEDSDYLYRMKLIGIRQDVDPALNPKVFRQSQTYEKDNQLVNNAMKVNREKYIQKWGGMPLLETFTKPYNKI